MDHKELLESAVDNYGLDRCTLADRMGYAPMETMIKSGELDHEDPAVRAARHISAIVHYIHMEDAEKLQATVQSLTSSDDPVSSFPATLHGAHDLLGTIQLSGSEEDTPIRTAISDMQFELSTIYVRIALHEVADSFYTTNMEADDWVDQMSTREYFQRLSSISAIPKRPPTITLRPFENELTGNVANLVSLHKDVARAVFVSSPLADKEARKTMSAREVLTYIADYIEEMNALPRKPKTPEQMVISEGEAMAILGVFTDCEPGNITPELAEMTRAMVGQPKEESDPRPLLANALTKMREVIAQAPGSTAPQDTPQLRLVTKSPDAPTRGR